MSLENSQWTTTKMSEHTVLPDGQQVLIMKVQQPKAILVSWAGTGTGRAPNPELYEAGVLGADSDGAAAGTLYHVTGIVGAKAWTSTGATVQGFYGG